MATRRVLQEREPNGGLRPYTFEWVCNNEDCWSRGHIHRKHVRARDPSEAWSRARAMRIPSYAKLMEEKAEDLLQRILW